MLGPEVLSVVMWAELTKPRNLPGWFWPAGSFAFALSMLLVSIGWLQWKVQYGFRPQPWDGGSERCFDNAEQFMPLAALLHRGL